MFCNTCIFDVFRLCAAKIYQYTSFHDIVPCPISERVSAQNPGMGQRSWEFNHNARDPAMRSRRGGCGLPFLCATRPCSQIVYECKSSAARFLQFLAKLTAGTKRRERFTTRASPPSFSGMRASLAHAPAASSPGPPVYCQLSPGR